MQLSECPVRPAIDVVEGKWKPIVVNALKAGRLRFGQLRRHVPEASRKVLTEQLRELEEDQIILRKAFGQKWERVEYELTVYGRTLVPVNGQFVFHSLPFLTEQLRELEEDQIILRK